MFQQNITMNFVDIVNRIARLIISLRPYLAKFSFFFAFGNAFIFNRLGKSTGSNSGSESFIYHIPNDSDAHKQYTILYGSSFQINLMMCHFCSQLYLFLFFCSQHFFSFAVQVGRKAPPISATLTFSESELNDEIDRMDCNRRLKWNIAENLYLKPFNEFDPIENQCIVSIVYTSL